MTIGNYEVVRKLATGGMGEVYLAHQTGPVDFRRQVVLKKLHRRLTSDPQAVAMFLNEARIAANLAHPNIVHIYELFEDGSDYVIAMEYVRGGTVLALLCGLEAAGRRGLPFGPAVRIATSVCEALYYAYNEPDAGGVGRRVVHCDVSPSNVLVGYDGQVKLADFGIATVIEDGATPSGTIKGKYGYLTPEQIRCEPLDQRSDVFSLGTTLWEMSLGRRLFQRDTEVQMVHAILEEAIPRPSELVPEFPLDLERVICKALARSRDDRYPDAHALADDLRAVARDHQWSCEQSALSQLVKDSLPDDELAFAGIGPDLDTEPPPRAITGGWVGAGSLAAVSALDAADRDALEARDRAWWARSTPATVAILLVLSVVFWLWIVPMIDPGPVALPMR